MMIESAKSILFLAADDGLDTTIQFVLFVVIAVGSIVGALFKKSAEKRQQEEAQRKAKEAKEILARRAQREQVRPTAEVRKDVPFGTMKKQPSLRDFIQQRAAAPPPAPPPVKPQPKPSMFAAPPKPIPVEEHHLVDLAPIRHLPPEDELVLATMPSETEHRRKRTAKKTLGDLVRTRRQPTPVRVERDIPPMSDVPESGESNIHTRVNLLDPATARAAIIFQEILSPPKALREGRELWD